MKIYISLLVVILFITIPALSFSQKVSKATLEKKFDDADYDFTIEDYYTAIDKFLFVYKHDSLNANVNYCIGLCYMKTKYD